MKMKIFVQVCFVFVIVVFIVGVVYVVDIVKIGFIIDMLGFYVDIDGQGGFEVICMVVVDFGGKVFGKLIEVVYVDYQNKVDIVVLKVCEWMDCGGFDLLVGGMNLVIVLLMNQVVVEKKKVYINIGVGVDMLINEQCMLYMVYYVYDMMVFVKGIGLVVVKQGGKSWFFLMVDYVFGKVFEKNMLDVVKVNGGQVFGVVCYLLFVLDFLLFLLQV